VLRRAKKLQKQLDKAQLQLTECRAQIRDLKLQLSDAGDCKVSITPCQDLCIIIHRVASCVKCTALFHVYS